MEDLNEESAKAVPQRRVRTHAREPRVFVTAIMEVNEVGQVKCSKTPRKGRRI